MASGDAGSYDKLEEMTTTGNYILTLKAPRKNVSENVVC